MLAESQQYVCWLILYLCAFAKNYVLMRINLLTLSRTRQTDEAVINVI
jgi:hypothetical protein